MIKPGTQDWDVQVRRAAGVLEHRRDWGRDRAIQLLIHTCQQVPVKYMVDLYEAAKKL